MINGKKWGLSSLILLLALYLSGCSTLRGGQQKLMLASLPEGSKVYFDGEFICETPCYSEIPRDKHATLTFEKPGYKKKSVELQSHYRWGDSFFSNFIWFFWGAPVGWVIDIMTGAAWEFEQENYLTLEPKNPKTKLPPIFSKNTKRKFTIAPPKARFELLSDEIGQKIAAETKHRYPYASVDSYEKTLDNFTLYSWNNSDVTPEKYQDDLFEKLNTRYLVETKTQEGWKELTLKSKVRDVFLEKTVDEFETVLPKSELVSAQRSDFLSTVLSLVSVVPNTLGYDFASRTFNIKQTEGYLPVPTRRDAVMSVISGISLGNTLSPYVMGGWKPRLRIVADVRYNYNEVTFERTEGLDNDLHGLVYYWNTAYLGGGPEVGLETPAGYLYFQLLPEFGLNEIHWRQRGLKHNSTDWGLGVKSEIGFSFFLSKSTTVNIFGKLVSTPSKQWSSILLRSTGRPIEVEDAGFFLGGITIGYYFPTINNLIKELFK